MAGCQRHGSVRIMVSKAKPFPQKFACPIRNSKDCFTVCANTHGCGTALLAQLYSRPSLKPHLQIASAQTVSFDLSVGTPFQQLVWRALLNIPWGQQCSYGELANAIGHAGAARAVGVALAHNPISILLPCHRVISKNEKLTGYAAGLVRKQALLLHEASSPIQ